MLKEEVHPIIISLNKIAELTLILEQPIRLLRQNDELPAKILEILRLIVHTLFTETGSQLGGENILFITQKSKGGEKSSKILTELDNTKKYRMGSDSEKSSSFKRLEKPEMSFANDENLRNAKANLARFLLSKFFEFADFLNQDLETSIENKSEEIDREFGKLILKLMNGVQLFRSELSGLLESSMGQNYIEEVDQRLCQLSLGNVFLITGVIGV